MASSDYNFSPWVCPLPPWCLGRPLVDATSFELKKLMFARWVLRLEE